MVWKTFTNLQVIGTTEEVLQRMFTPGRVVADVRPRGAVEHLARTAGAVSKRILVFVAAQFAACRAAQRNSGRVMRVRTLIIVFFTFSAAFWMFFALSHFPWVVPADHNGTLLKHAERSSAAGACLFALSLVSIWLPTGVLGRNRVLVVVALFTGVAWLAVTPFLYPDMEFVRFPYRVSAHLLGFLALLTGVAKTYIPRSAT